ncbi:MAG TPA: CHAT domain-containing protein, partial [Roseiflexaceae bacterium]|nr:CHAT domain-containing protein [Roseiflexaceae bacterium]
EIGMPYPVRPRGPEMALEIQHHGPAQLTIAFYKDFPQGAAHLQRLAALPFSVGSASPRNDVLTLFTQQQPHLVYFYCHGIDRDHVPFLRVGTEHDDDYISTSNILNYDVDWSQTRPLVFINGCQTAALAPDRALQFVRAFVEDALAAGVIGTEITVFEPLAQRFAETFLGQFVAGVPLGRAVRIARLALLAEQNPLGLVYIPHAYAGLRMVAT